MAPAFPPCARPLARAASPFRVLLLAGLLVLGGCAGLFPAPPPVAVAAPSFPLLSPASYGRSASFEQLLYAAHGDQEASLQCLVTISPERIVVIGLTAMGQRVFSLDYDGSTLRAERSAFAPDRVQPQRILADLQFALWPLPALETALAGSPWRVSEPRPGLRRLRHGPVLVAELHRAGAERFWLSQLRDGYALEIQQREVAP